jgi:sugar lactone lactonase YvrE
MAALAAFSAAPAQTLVQLPDSLHAPADTILWVKKVQQFCEGPAWDAATGSVYFTRQISNAANWPIFRVRPGVDTGAEFISAAYQANGLEMDPQNRLVAAQNARLTRYKNDGSVDSTLIQSGANGVTFGQANDLSIGGNGGIYFTTNSTSIYYLSPARQLSVAYANATSANGVEWVEEDSAVYVNESRLVKRYKVGANGALSNPTTFITVASGSGGTYADGGTIDAHGNRYVANFQLGELRVFNARGDSIGRIVMRVATGTNFDAFTGNMGNVSNAAFGGPDLKTLYFTGDGGLYSIRLKIPGRVRPNGPIALRAPRAHGPMSLENPGALQNRDVRGRRLAPAGNLPALTVPGEPGR